MTERQERFFALLKMTYRSVILNAVKDPGSK
jgi:hypothetical protein